MCQAMYYGSAKPVEPPSTHHEHHNHPHPHHHHRRSRSHSSFRPGPGTNTLPTSARNRSESRSFTSLDPVDEESQLLLKDDVDSITGYRDPVEGTSSEHADERYRDSGVTVVEALGRTNEEGSGEMTPTPTGLHRDR